MKPTTAPKKPSLMELADDRRIIIDRIIAQFGEVTDEDQDALAATDAKLEDKFSAYLAVIDHMEDTAARAKTEAEIANAYAKACSNAVEGLRYRMAIALGSADLKNVKAGYRTVSISAARPSVRILNENLLPPSVAEVQIIEKLVIDKKAILAKMQAGEEVPGAAIDLGRATIRVTSPRKTEAPAAANTPEEAPAPAEVAA